MFCKHEWQLLSETVTKSKFEISMNAAFTSDVRPTSLPGQLCDASRKHIQTFSCDKCGKLKRFVEEILGGNMKKFKGWIFKTALGDYYREPGEGQTSCKHEAHIYSAKEARSEFCEFGPKKTYGKWIAIYK